MVLEVFAPIKKIKKVSEVSIDNTVFRLHYKVTIIFLLACSLLVGATQYVGQPIDCIPDEKVAREPLNAYCWIHSTFTGVELNASAKRRLQTYPGVFNTQEGEVMEKHHKFYQWVPIMLFIQGCLFYVGRHFWKNIWEGGIMKDLVLDLTAPIGDPEKRTKRKPLLLNYLVDHMGSHKTYAYYYFFCELLNLVNVIGQIFLVDKFLDYEFTNYGIEVLAFINDSNPGKRINPMTRVFPKMTKCIYTRYGPSGELVPYDSLCILPVNNINEKIYVFLWVWLMFLAVVTSIMTLFRIMTLLCVPLRSWILRLKSSATNYTNCKSITVKISFPDWFVLTQIGDNVDSVVFEELVQDLETKLEAVKMEWERKEKAAV